MSPIKFRSPTICSSTNGDALANSCRKAKTLSRCPAATDLFFAPLCVHDNATALSLNRPTCLQRRFLVPTIPYNTSHARSFPAISRQFISKFPPGFISVTSLACNLFGHPERQIVGSSASFPNSQPPPTPSPDSSTQTRNSGYPMTNYFAVVGSRAAYFSSFLQYRNYCFTADKYFHRTIRGFTCRIF